MELYGIITMQEFFEFFVLFIARNCQEMAPKVSFLHRVFLLNEFRVFHVSFIIPSIQFFAFLNEIEIEIFNFPFYSSHK